jgi:hypothetical protein
VTSANQRSALAALHQVRPTIARLDVGRHSEDVAADLIEAWNGTEIALRSLVGGSALSGQPLIRELRQRELLSLSQAHALIEFLAARDRAERTDYRPTSADVAAARHGFQELEGALTVVPAPELSTAAGAPIPAADQAPATEARGSTTRRMPRWALVVAGLVVLVVPVGGYFAWSWWSRRDERAIVEAAALYQRRQLGEARRAFGTSPVTIPGRPSPTYTSPGSPARRVTSRRRANGSTGRSGSSPPTRWRFARWARSCSSRVTSRRRSASTTARSAPTPMTGWRWGCTGAHSPGWGDPPTRCASCSVRALESGTASVRLHRPRPEGEQTASQP